MKTPHKCPVCPGDMEVVEVQCKQCGTSIKGHFDLPAEFSLTDEERQILKTFLQSRGSIKDVQEAHGFSYQAANSRLKIIVDKLLPSAGDGSGVGKGEGPIINNSSFLKIQTFVEKLPGIINKNCDTMVAYYGRKESNGGKKGLVWVEYPYPANGLFKVHLMKERGFTYPAELIAKLAQYKQDGWGHYPEFLVRNDTDADVAIELIKVAQQNLSGKHSEL